MKACSKGTRCASPCSQHCASDHNPAQADCAVFGLVLILARAQAASQINVQGFLSFV